jgi:CMP-N,N'-diacetyllegionaminic acid synthase
MTGPRVLLAIPARGGSKRLPRKNLLCVGGKSLLAHTVEAAFGSGLAEQVYVCSEDAEILRAAGALGATAFPIPQDMAGDEVSSTVPVVALHKALAATGDVADILFNLQPSSPLRTGSDIAGAFSALIGSAADFVVSATRVDPHYFHWALHENLGEWKMYFDDKYLMDRHHLPEVLRPNGAIKGGRAAKVLECGHFFGPPLTVYNMPEERSIHVATQFDLLCADAILAKGEAR